MRLLMPVWSPALLEKRDIIDTDEIPKDKLKDFPFQNHPNYMALSSTWGEETPTKAISINGTVVQVRSNLARALQSTTHFDPYIVVGLCLAGPAPNASTKDLLTHFSDIEKGFWRYDLDEEIDHLFSRFKHPPGKQGAFPTDEYLSFSARLFWSWIWVLQEVYLAKRLHYACGSCYLASNCLAGALILFETF
ncbi:hypothetical protein F4859DRAFT_525142 [Xylaria cf. heliscus]|nr:hypothetical protein F4859DRAFT_525142 [Xylaria cf. heliscus]